MHEVGITTSMIEIALDHARTQGGGAKIHSLTMEIGALSGVVPEAIRFCFEACSQGTLAEGARLIIEEIAARAHCSSCDAEVELATQSFACPHCGDFALQLLCGEELRLKELEVE